VMTDWKGELQAASTRCINPNFVDRWSVALRQAILLVRVAVGPTDSRGISLICHPLFGLSFRAKPRNLQFPFPSFQPTWKAQSLP
jgi:hypothetical protein